MASQRPSWFRLQSTRAAAPPPAPAPAPPRPPAVMRPAFPVRPPPPPAQTQEPAAPPPPVPAASPPSPPTTAAATAPPSPPSPPVPAAAPPRSPVAAPAPKSPVAPPPRPPVTPPPPTAPRSPPRSPPKSPTPTPPPSSPVAKSNSSNLAPPSSSSVPQSPQKKAQFPSPSKPASAEAVNGKAASPKTVKLPSAYSPSQSPKAHPPSPLKLPPSKSEGDELQEPKIQQKNVLVQETIDKSMKMHNPHNHGIPSKGKREPPLKDKLAPSKKSSDSEDLGMRVITIAGDNKGAVMEINSPNKKLFPGQKSEKETTMQSQPTATFLNSNVQGVNNSIVFNSICHHNDPGIHLSLQVRRANNGARYKD